MDILKHYVDLFNKEDEELYINDIDNSHAYEWLKSEIPLFECSDKDIERKQGNKSICKRKSFIQLVQQALL